MIYFKKDVKMSQSNDKTGIFLPPPHILANVTLKTIHLKTQITVHWALVESVRRLADCGLGFLFYILPHSKLRGNILSLKFNLNQIKQGKATIKNFKKI